MKLFNNKVLPVIFIAVFSILTSGCRSGKIEFVLGPRYTAPILEDHGTFVIKNDGTKIDAKEIRVNPYGKIEVDDKNFRKRDIKVIQRVGQYFVNYKGHIATLMIKGKINLYQYATSNISSGQPIYLYFYQIGKDGEVKILSKLKELAALTIDCPTVYDKLNRPYAEIRDEYRKDEYYVFNLIRLYNRTCGK